MNKDEWTHHCKVCLRENADCTCKKKKKHEYYDKQREENMNKHHQWIDDCMRRDVSFKARLEEFKAHGDWGADHLAMKFLELQPAISAMGGWANYRHWSNRHAASYFNVAEGIQKELAKAKQALKDIANNNNNEEPRAYAKRMLEELEHEKKDDI